VVGPAAAARPTGRHARAGSTLSPGPVAAWMLSWPGCARSLGPLVARAHSRPHTHSQPRPTRSPDPLAAWAHWGCEWVVSGPGPTHSPRPTHSLDPLTAGANSQPRTHSCCRPTHLPTPTHNPRLTHSPDPLTARGHSWPGPTGVVSGL